MATAEGEGLAWCIANRQHGRCIIAQRSIAAGQLLFSQPPYAAVLYDESSPRFCDFCMQSVRQLLRCSRCRLVWYCSRTHQAVAWRAGHKEECAALAACAPRIPPPTIRLAARALWRKARDAQPKGASALSRSSELHNSYSTVESLLAHWEELDDKRKSLYSQMAVVTCQYMRGASLPSKSTEIAPASSSNSLLNSDNMIARTDSNMKATSNGDANADTSESAGRLDNAVDHRQVALLLARFACNNHTICDDELRPYGVGLYPLGALLNHHCQPNCMQSFHGPDICFRAIRSIAPDEECTISYVELADTRRRRRAQLLSLYLFDIDANCPSSGPLSTPAGRGGLTAAAAPALSTAHIQQHCAEAQPSLPPSPAQVGVPHHQALAQQEAQTCSACTKPPPISQLSLSAAAAAACLALDPELVCVPVSSVPSAPQQLGSASMSPHRPAPIAVHTFTTEDPADGVPYSVVVAVYSVSSTPPWRCDEKDASLTCVVSSSVLGSAASGTGRIVQGGLDAQLCLLGQGCMFDDDNDGGMQDASVHADSDSAAGLAAHHDRHPQPHRQQQQQPRVAVTVECWGRWALTMDGSHCHVGAGLTLATGAAACGGSHAAAEGLPGAAGIGGKASSTGNGTHVSAAACSLAKRCAAALLMQHHAEAAPAPGAAVRLLHPALFQLDPGEATLGLGPAHMLRLRLDAALMKAAIDEGGSWPLALQAAERLLVPYQLAYTTAWPNLSLHWALVARLRLLLEDPLGAATAAQAAQQGLRITHPESAALRLVEETQRQAMAEAAHQKGGLARR